MNESKCPVPREQQPTNEFIELSKSKIFSWPKTKKLLILILIKFWMGAFVLFLLKLMAFPIPDRRTTLIPHIQLFQILIY